MQLYFQMNDSSSNVSSPRRKQNWEASHHCYTPHRARFSAGGKPSNPTDGKGAQHADYPNRPPLHMGGWLKVMSMPIPRMWLCLSRVAEKPRGAGLSRLEGRAEAGFSSVDSAVL